MAVTECRNFYCRTRFDASYFFQLFSKILVIRVLLNCAVWQGFFRGLAWKLAYACADRMFVSRQKLAFTVYRRYDEYMKLEKKKGAYYLQ